MTKYDTRAPCNSISGLKTKVAVLDEIVSMVEALPDEADVVDELLRNRNKLAKAIDERADSGPGRTEFELPAQFRQPLAYAMHRYGKDLPRATNRAKKRRVNLVGEAIKNGEYPVYRFSLPTDKVPVLMEGITYEVDNQLRDARDCREARKLIQTQMRRQQVRS